MPDTPMQQSVLNAEELEMAFSKDVVQQVWEKAWAVSTHDPNIWRKDECGAWIRREHYADRDSEFGWEINHVPPGDPDDVSTLRALHWRNNVHTGVARLRCKVKADAEGMRNREAS